MQCFKLYPKYNCRNDTCFYKCCLRTGQANEMHLRLSQRKNKSSSPTESQQAQEQPLASVSPSEKWGFSCSPPVSPRGFIILFRKCWRSSGTLGTKSLSMFSKVIHYKNFFTNLLYQQVPSVLILSLCRLRREK